MHLLASALKYEYVPYIKHTRGTEIGLMQKETMRAHQQISISDAKIYYSVDQRKKRVLIVKQRRKQRRATF